METFFKYSFFFVALITVSSCENEGAFSKVHFERLTDIDEFGEGKPRVSSTRQLFTGTAINNHENGSLFWEIDFTSGKRDGTTRYFFDNGQLATETSYKNGKPRGKSVRYFRSGQKKSETTFRKNGTPKFKIGWDEKTGVKDFEVNYDVNGQNELLIAYYPKGHKRMIREYMKGVLIKEETWYEDKQLEKSYVYDENGEPVAKKDFYRNGQPKRVEAYVDNIRHGEYIEYFSNGTIRRYGNFNRGVRDGEFRRYYQTGELMAIAFFNMGIPQSQATYNPSGKKISDKFNWN